MRAERLGLVVAALLVALGSGCTPDPSPTAVADVAHIVAPTEFEGAGMAYTDSRAGVPYTVGDLIICLDRPGSVVIDRIEPKDAFGGLRLNDFAVIPNAMETGGHGFANNTMPIAEQVPNPSRTMTEKCPVLATIPATPAAEAKSVALLLEYSKPADATAGNRGIVLWYTSGGRQLSTFLDWQIVLCAPGDVTTPNCPKR